MREIITLACTTCKSRTYTSTRKKTPGVSRLEIKKYCPECRKHTGHKETK